METQPATTDGWNRRGLLRLVGLIALVGVVQFTTDFGLWGTVAGVAGLAFLVGGLRSVWLTIASRSVEQEAIGSIGDSSVAVQIEGTAEAAEEPITAPLTGTESVAYQVYVTRWKPEGTDAS